MKRFLSVMALALSLSQSLLAAETPFYAGLRVGNAMEDRLPQEPGGLDTDTPFGSYAGYRFSEFWGVEVGYSDLGSSSRAGIADAGFELDGSIWTVGGTGTVPINEQFSAFGGAGYFDLSEDGTAITIAGLRRISADDSGFYIEAGGRFHFNERVAARASYQWFDFDQDSDGTPWLGLEVNF